MPDFLKGVAWKAPKNVAKYSFYLDILLMGSICVAAYTFLSGSPSSGNKNQGASQLRRTAARILFATWARTGYGGHGTAATAPEAPSTAALDGADFPRFSLFSVLCPGIGVPEYADFCCGARARPTVTVGILAGRRSSRFFDLT